MPPEETYSFCLILLVTLSITSTRGNGATHGTNRAREVTQLTQFQCHCHFLKMCSCSLSDFPISLILGTWVPLRIYMAKHFAFMAYHSTNCRRCECSYWHTWKNDLTV